MFISGAKVLWLVLNNSKLSLDFKTAIKSSAIQPFRSYSVGKWRHFLNAYMRLSELNMSYTEVLRTSSLKNQQIMVHIFN